jgi:hypothetical protein
MMAGVSVQLIVGLVWICAGTAWAAQAPQRIDTRPLRINDIQTVGSHNSYKLAMSADNFAALSEARPEVASSLEYSHRQLPEQLQLGIRKLELDVFYDPDGTLFPGRAPDSQFPVLHVQNLDDRSHCRSLVHCLSVLRTWSEQHPRHIPVFISFNAKDAPVELPGAVVPQAFSEDAWQSMDHELRSVLGGKLITPAEVFASGQLQWPLLDAARGRFIAVLDEGGDKRRSYASDWRDRAMFANLEADQPGAAIMIINDPITDFERITEMVQAGYIVRTRADADTREARNNDTRRRDQAFASGAHLVSTDYYLPAQHFDSDYVVRLKAPARCNPVRIPVDCLIAE